ncbi:MAG: hypothetical protein HY876_02490 [Coriobacteriales bacterium]|nr:hypothetical protein [Coriobacteriales bacterium]
MHDGVTGGSDVDAGTRVRAVVVCVHVFGVGVYLAAHEVFGHVNAPELLEGQLAGLSDYPSVGAVLDLIVLGRSGTGQLRLGRPRLAH